MLQGCYWLNSKLYNSSISSAVNSKVSAIQAYEAPLYFDDMTTTFENTYSTYTYDCFMALFQDHPGEPMPEEKNLLLDFIVQGKIIKANTPTIRLGATPSGLISDSPPSFPIFTPHTLPAAYNSFALTRSIHK